MGIESHFSPLLAKEGVGRGSGRYRGQSGRIPPTNLSLQEGESKEKWKDTTHHSPTLRQLGDEEKSPSTQLKVTVAQSKNNNFYRQTNNV